MENVNIKQEYIFQNASNVTIPVGVLSALSFLIGLYVFGYYYTYRNTKFDTKYGKNYSISNNLSSGSQVGMLVSFSLGYVLLVALLYLKFAKQHSWLIYFIPLVFIITAVFGLLISMVIYSPFKADGSKYQAGNTEHGVVATVAFTLALIFNIFINGLLITNNKYYLPWLVGLSLLEAGAYFGLFSDAYYEYTHIDPTKSDSQTVFDTLENINYCFIVITILILTFSKAHNVVK